MEIYTVVEMEKMEHLDMGEELIVMDSSQLLEICKILEKYQQEKTTVWLFLQQKYTDGEIQRMVS